MSVCCPACVLQELCLTWEKGSSAPWSPWLHLSAGTLLRESVMLILILALFSGVWRLCCPELCQIINWFSFLHVCVSWCDLYFWLGTCLGMSVGPPISFTERCSSLSRFEPSLFGWDCWISYFDWSVVTLAMNELQWIQSAYTTNVCYWALSSCKM